MTQELTTTFSFEITSLKEAMDYAQLIADSDLAPKDYKGKAGNVLIAIQYGMEVGLKPIQSIQNISVINGRPTIWGDALIALVQNHPLCEYINEEIKNDTAYCSVKRCGEEAHIAKFSMDDAKKAGLLGKPGPWTNYPLRMLQMRARGFALRDKFSDILKGISMREEVMDYEDISKTKNKTASNKISSLIERKATVIEMEIQDSTELKNVLTLIENASSLDELNKSADQAKSLPEKEKIRARNCYNNKKAKFKEETINAETGEILNSDVIQLSEFEKIKNQLLNAKSQDTLDIAADLIRSTETQEQMDELLEIYKQKKEFIK